MKEGRVQFVVAVSSEQVSKGALPVPTDRSLRVELGPFGPTDIVRWWMKSLPEATSIPDDLLDTASEVTSGNPLLLEQALQAFITSKVVVFEGDHVRFDLSKLPETHFPVTPEDALTHRIFSLPAPERMLLEHASVFSGPFWLSGLMAISRMAATPRFYGAATVLPARILWTYLNR